MKKSLFFAGVAIFAWSTVATISKLLLGAYTGMQVLCLSSFFGFLFLLLLNGLSGNLKQIKKLKGKDFLKLSLMGLPGIFFYNLFLYGGTARMQASQAFIINYLWPIMSVIFACLILKEKLTLRKIIAIVISFLGVVIVAGSSLAVLDKTFLLGAFFCAMGAVSYGIFTAVNQKYPYDKRIAMMFYYLVTFVLTFVICLGSGDLKIPMNLSLVGFVWNGVVSMSVGTTSWAIALESGNTAKISNLAYITPFLSLVWTSLILKEKISVFSILGLLVIIFGIFIQIKTMENHNHR